MKIVIIDDNEQDRKIMKRFLSKAGYEDIVLAEDGTSGVEKTLSEKPSLVVLDTLLPDMVGFEVCSKIRETLNSDDLKIIMMTGSIDAVDAVKAKQVGADDYCVKTADCDALLAAVKRLFGGAE